MSFWYLANILPYPPWLIKATDRIIFTYLWGTKGEQIKRTTLYLPKCFGRLGIFNVTKQNLAMRTKLVAHVVNPNYKLKWAYLARYFVGFDLGRCNPDWNFLRSNLLPKPVTHTIPIFYIDVLMY